MQRFVRQVWIAVGIAAVVLLGAWLARSLLYGLLVIFAGMLLGVFLGQLSRLLQRSTGVAYQVSYGLVVLALVLIAAGVIVLMGTQIAEQAGEFMRQFRESAAQLEKRLQAQTWWTQLQDVRSSAADLLTSRQAVSTATSAVSSTVSALAATVLVGFLGLYFSAKPERYRNGLLSLVPRSSRDRVGEVMDMQVRTLWYWILGRMAGMLVIGIGSAIGLWLLGVPLPASLGVLAGVLTFIPNVGPLIALVPAVLFGLQQGTDTALYVVLFYFALQTVESYVLTPMIDQYQVAVPPGLTLSAQLLFGLVGGVIGLVLATPLVVVITVLVREFYVKDVLGSEPLTGQDA
jgi:predicted PurR-regulated permease PerM